MSTFRFKIKHHCDLETIEQFTRNGEQPTASPFANLCLKLCWQWHYYSTISSHHPQACIFFRSNYLINHERKRHLSTPSLRWTIHPFSEFIQHFQFVAAILWYLMLFYEQFIGGFYDQQLVMENADHDPDLKYMHLVLKIYSGFEIFSMIVYFCSGYAMHETQHVELNMKMTAKKYLSSYFLLDLVLIVSCWSFYLIPNLSNNQKLAIYELRLLRIFRVVTIGSYVSEIMRRFKISNAVSYVLFLIFIGFLIIHFATCFFVNTLVMDTFITQEIMWNMSWRKVLMKEDGEAWEDMETFYLYKRVFPVINANFFGAPYNFHEYSFSETVILTSTLMLGFCFYILSIGLCLILFGIVNVSESKFEEMQERINKFMESKQYPPDLRLRIHQFYDFKYGRRFFREDSIFAQMSDHLRNEVLLFSCRLLIEKVQIFKGLSRPAIGALITILKHDIFLAGDVIVEADQVTDSLYLILHGTCAVLLPNGDELMHVEDGDEFGETDKLKRENGLTLGLVAIEPTELFYLTQKDLQFVGNLYPEVLYKIDSVMRAKTRLYESLLQDDESVKSLKEQDIVVELKKGRILSRRKRWKKGWNVQFT